MSGDSVGKGVVTIGADTSRLSDEVSSGVDGQAGAISKVFGGLGKAAGAAFAVTAAAGIAAAAGLAKIGESFDSAFDGIRVQTGKTGDALAGLQSDFRAVVKTVPADFGDAGVAIGGFSQKLGLTGQPLQALSEQVLNLSRITKTDLGSNVKATSDLFNNWGTAASEQGPKLDELFRISQQTGVSVGDLAQQMSDGGVQFRQAGLGFEQSGALLGLLAKNGLSASDVLPALTKSMAAAAKGGKDASTAFQATFTAIKNAPNDTKAAGIALDVFGGKAGPKFAALIREGKLSYEDLAATIASGGDTINKASDDTADWSEKLKILTNKALLVLEPIASRVFDGISTVIDRVSGAVKDFVAGFTKGIDELGSSQSKFAVFGAVVFEQFSKIRQWFVAHWPQIKEVVLTVFRALGTAAAWVAEVVVPKVMAALKWVVAWVVEHWPQIKAVVLDVFDKVKTAVLYVVEQVLPKIGAAFKTAFGWLMDNKEVLIGVAAAIAVGLIAMFASWVAGAVSAAAATIVAAAPIIAIGLAIAGLVAGVLYAYHHFQTFHDIVDAVGRAIKTATGWLLDHKIVLYAVAAAIALLVAPIPTVIAALIYAWIHFQTFRDIVMGVVNVVRDIISGFVTAIQDLWARFGDGIVALASAAWQTISGVVQGAVDVIVGIFNFFKDLFTGQWGKLWGDVRDILFGLWEQIKAVLQGAVDGAIAILGLAWDAIKLAVSVAWDGIKAYFALSWEAIKLVFSLAIDAITGLLGLAWDAIAAAVGLVWDGIKAYFDLWWAGVKLVFSLAIDAISTAIGVMGTAASAVWHAVFEPFIDFITGAFATAMGGAKSVWDGITAAVDLVSTAVSTVWHTWLEPLASFLGDAFDKAWQAAKTAIGYVTEPFTKVIGWIDSIISKATTAVGLVQDLLGGGVSATLAPGLATSPKLTSSGGGGGVARRVTGGTASAGMPYIVGEKRPELFVPGSDGYIFPDLGGSLASTRAAGSGSGERIGVKIEHAEFHNGVDVDAVARVMNFHLAAA